jgi:Ca2+-transporting ATPase
MSQEKGLTWVEAEERHRRFGPNEITHARAKAGLKDLRDVLLDPMGLMLLGLAVLYRLMGEVTDSWMILFAWFPITAVDVALGIRANRALRTLRSTLQARAKVLREGQVVEISTRKIVPGDWLVFEEGQVLPADGVVMESHLLTVSEAALTGESLPIEKERGSRFFAGTTVLHGRGLGCVDRMGRHTRFGGIAELLEKSQLRGSRFNQSPLQRIVRKLILRIFFLAGVLTLLLFGLLIYRGEPFIESLVQALTFAMSAIPEEFAIVFALYLSLGAYRLSRHGILVKSLPTVETLGRVDVICSDKTGTLTEGRFEVGEKISWHGALSGHEFDLIARLACEKDPVDVMEQAIELKISDSKEILSEWELVYDYPFDPKGKYMSHVWSNRVQPRQLIAMKGSVEGVLDHCDAFEEKAGILKQAESLAAQGKRVLGLATREGTFTGSRTEDEKGLKFIGFLSFSDPVRVSAKVAVLECRRMGIQMKLVTGDHPATARSVAREIGLIHGESEVHTGNHLQQMDEKARKRAYLTGTVFARVLPEQKYEMVQCLQERGLRVAMMGDGINDAPALRSADIGISMGLGATDVARSSAGMILLRNDFGGIVHAVFEGRRIFANLKKSFSYLISFHIPVMVLAIVPAMLGWGAFLLPVHIVLLELMVHPVSAFSFENLPATGKASISDGFINFREAIGAVLTGLCLSLLALWRFYSRSDQGVEAARSSGLMVLLLGNVFLVFMEIGDLRSLRAWLSGVFLFGISWVLMSSELVGRWFHLISLTRSEVWICFLLGAVACLPALTLRWCTRQRMKKPRLESFQPGPDR